MAAHARPSRYKNLAKNSNTQRAKREPKKKSRFKTYDKYIRVGRRESKAPASPIFWRRAARPPTSANAVWKVPYGKRRLPGLVWPPASWIALAIAGGEDPDLEPLRVLDRV